MWKVVRGWSDRPLSRAGKEVMLKSVIQTFPIYVMSCFRLPAGICEKMRMTISNYFWGIENGKKKMYWRSWEWLTTPKALGGMGFRDMELFSSNVGKTMLETPYSATFSLCKGAKRPLFSSL